MTAADAQPDGRDETSAQRADRNWEELIQELRVMQTGAQILVGFLLAVSFQPAFDKLTASQRTLYIVLVLLAATASVLALTPVGLHRLLFARGRKPALVLLAHRIVIVNLVVIAALTLGVMVLIIDFTFGRTFALVAAGVGLVVIVILWIVLPLRVRHGRRPRAER